MSRVYTNKTEKILVWSRTLKTSAQKECLKTLNSYGESFEIKM